MGRRDRAARLAIPRLASPPPAGLLVLARPQGPCREPALARRQRTVYLRPGDALPILEELPERVIQLCAVTLAISAVQLAVRAILCAHIYGWRFAAGVPLRILWGNLINSAAT